MSFHYSPDTANALLRQLAEEHLAAQVVVGTKNRATLPTTKLLIISSLLGQLHHANGPIKLSFLQAALVTFEPNSDAFAAAVAYGVELGLLQRPEAVKVVNDNGYATNGMLLALTSKGKELTTLAATKEGQQQGWQYIRGNRHRMDRKGRSKPAPAIATNDQQMDKKGALQGQHTGNTSEHRPTSRSNTAHPLGETPPDLEATKSRLEVGLYRETERSRRDLKEKQELSPADAELVVRSEKKKMVEAAIAYYDDNQVDCGGYATRDDDTLDAILSVAVSKSDADVEEALGTAIARGYSYWVAGRPCPYGVGQLTAAVRDSWRELMGFEQTPDAPSRLYWINGLGRWDTSSTPMTSTSSTGTKVDGRKTTALNRRCRRLQRSLRSQ